MTVAINHHPSPSADPSSRSPAQSGPATSSDSTYTKVGKQDGLNSNPSFGEGLSSSATSVDQSTGKSSATDDILCGPNQSILAAKQTQLAALVFPHDCPLKTEDVARIAIGPSSLDIYLRFEDRFERCVLGLPGERVKDFILDPKLAQVLETL